MHTLVLRVSRQLLGESHSTSGGNSAGLFGVVCVQTNSEVERRIAALLLSLSITVVHPHWRPLAGSSVLGAFQPTPT